MTETMAAVGYSNDFTRSLGGLWACCAELALQISHQYEWAGGEPRFPEDRSLQYFPVRWWA